MAYESDPGSVYPYTRKSFIYAKTNPFARVRSRFFSRSDHYRAHCELDLNFDHLADSGEDEAGTYSYYTPGSMSDVTSISFPYSNREESFYRREKIVVFTYNGGGTYNNLPGLKIRYKYYDNERTKLKSIRRYDYAFERRKTPGNFDGFEYPRTPRLRTEICYDQNGNITDRRCWHYNDATDWHKKTCVERRISAEINSDDNIVLGSGSNIAQIVIGRFPSEEYTIHFHGILLMSKYDSGGTPAERTWNYESLYVHEDYNTFRYGVVGSKESYLWEREANREQGDWAVDADGNLEHTGSDPSAVITVFSMDDERRIFSRITSDYNADVIVTDERLLNARTGALAKKTTKAGNGPWATSEGIDPDAVIAVTTYDMTPTGKMIQKQTVNKYTGEDVKESTTTYVYNTHTISKRETVLDSVEPDGSSVNRWLTNYYENNHHCITSIDKQGYVPIATLASHGITKPSEADDCLAYITMRIKASSGIYSKASAFLNPVWKGVAKILMKRTVISASEVNSIITGVRKHVAAAAGYIQADFSAELNFWLTSIQCAWGCLDKAEDQLQYIDRCLEVISRHGLANDLLENCDISVWGLAGLTSATWCEEGYTFDADLIKGAIAVTSDCITALKTNEIDLNDAVAAINDSIAKARPRALPDAEKIAVRIINLALARSGTTRQIYSLDEETTEGIVSRVLFEQCRRKILTAQAWSWCVTDIHLTTKKNTLLNPERWPLMARLPSDCLTTCEIWSGHRNERFDHLIPFEVNGRRVFCEIENPWMRYVRDAPLTAWPELALDALGWELAAELTMPLTVKPELATALFKMAELAIERAYAHDRNQQVKDPDPPSRFITARN